MFQQDDMQVYAIGLKFHFCINIYALKERTSIVKHIIFKKNILKVKSLEQKLAAYTGMTEFVLC